VQDAGVDGDLDVLLVDREVVGDQDHDAGDRDNAGQQRGRHGHALAQPALRTTRPGWDGLWFLDGYAHHVDDRIRHEHCRLNQYRVQG
jgi:hypothetical protein